MSGNPAASRNAPITWRSFILSLYPDALRRTYCVPPEHFNRVPYDRDTVPGTGLSALVLPVPVTPPVHNVPPVSQPSGSATPIQNVPSVSQPSGSAAPVQNVPPVSQLVNPPTQYRLWPEESQRPATPVRVQESDFRDDTAPICGHWEMPAKSPCSSCPSSTSVITSTSLLTRPLCRLHNSRGLQTWARSTLLAILTSY